MTTSADTLVKEGMNPIQARALATEIDAGASADAGKLIRMGFSAPLANELKAQAVLGTGTVKTLMALGVPGNLAVAVKAAIDA